MLNYEINSSVFHVGDKISQKYIDKSLLIYHSTPIDKIIDKVISHSKDNNTAVITFANFVLFKNQFRSKVKQSLENQGFIIEENFDQSIILAKVPKNANH